jgi:hypothetical protein
MGLAHKSFEIPLLPPFALCVPVVRVLEWLHCCMLGLVSRGIVLQD